jgi:hypothetical protein
MTDSHVLQILTPSAQAMIIVAVATAATAVIGAASQMIACITPLPLLIQSDTGLPEQRIGRALQLAGHRPDATRISRPRPPDRICSSRWGRSSSCIR